MVVLYLLQLYTQSGGRWVRPAGLALAVCETRTWLNVMLSRLLLWLSTSLSFCCGSDELNHSATDSPAAYCHQYKRDSKRFGSFFGPSSRTLASTQFSIVAEHHWRSFSGNQCCCSALRCAHSTGPQLSYLLHMSTEFKTTNNSCDTTHGLSICHSDHHEMFVGWQQKPDSAAIGQSEKATGSTLAPPL